MDDNRSLSYFFLGLGVGVAVGMVFAPQAGSETRTLLRTRASEGGDYIRRRGGDLREGASGLVDKGREVLNQGRERVTSAVDAGRQAYRETSSAGAPADPLAPAEGI
ncbi:MAG TPA: YtxH domain-containing protein [Bryobacteraceae bacterium]|nr:YtxH domain-containing protein [Bryobacteraceae bacterium]